MTDEVSMVFDEGPVSSASSGNLLDSGRGLLADCNWTETPLGGPENWPFTLQTLVSILFGSSQPMFLVWGSKRTLLYNEAYSTILAAKHPSALGRDFLEVWSEIRDALTPIVEQAYRGEPVVMDDIELWMERRGFVEEAHFSFSYTPVRDERGEVPGFFCACQETTGQIIAERRLRQSEARAQADAERVRLALAAGAIIGTWFWDLRTDSFTVDEQFAEAFGIDPEQGRDGLSLEQVIATVHSDDKAGLIGAINEAISRGGAYAHQYRVRRADGKYYWIEANGRVDRDADGTALSFPGVVLDVEDRRRAELALRETTRRLDAILENTREAVFLMDDRQHCIYANPAAERLTGYTFEELARRPLHDVIHCKHPDGSHYPIEDCPIDRAFPERAHTMGEELFVAPDGSFYPVAFTASPVLDDSGTPIGTVIEARNIAEEKARDAALLEETHTLETLNRTGQIVAAELDLSSIVQKVTDAGVELTGAQFGAFFYNAMNDAGEAFMLYSLSGAERSEFERFGMPRATAIFQPTFKGEGVVRSGNILADTRYGKSEPHRGMPEGHLPVSSYLAVPVTSRSGEVIGGLFFGHPERDRFTERHERLIVGIAAQAAIAIDNSRLYQEAQRELQERIRAERALRELNDTLEERVRGAIAERERAEDALRQAQKMEAVGQLTGGLAHDFNNLLAGISGSLELMGARIAQGRLPDVERYLVAAQGATKRAAALTHRLLAFSRRQTLDPKPTNVGALINGMEDLIRRTVGPAIAVESVAGGGVWSVLVDPNQLENSLLNLCINARDAMPDGGKITIETCNRWLDERAARMRDLPPGQYVSLCVSDNGTGMSREVAEKAFDPFFTTKPIGMGTGLGLSMIYGFARQSGGQVRIYSELGTGTMVCIYLPRSLGDGGMIEDGSEALVVEHAGAGETVLVIDDEPLVRMLVTDTLEELGYTAIEAEDGPSGMKVIQSNARIDLLITDVGLPNGMNGRQVAEAARQLRPHLKVLFITGYAENAVLNHGHLEHGMQVVTKPFDMAELARRIQTIISNG